MDVLEAEGILDPTGGARMKVAKVEFDKDVGIIRRFVKGRISRDGVEPVQVRCMERFKGLWPVVRQEARS